MKLPAKLNEKYFIITRNYLNNHKEESWTFYTISQGRMTLNLIVNWPGRRFSCLLQSRKHPLTYLARAISALSLSSPLYHHQKSGHTEILRTPDRTPVKEFQEVITRWTLPSNHLLSLLSSYHGQELDGKETVEQIGPWIPEMLSVTVQWKAVCRLWVETLKEKNACLFRRRSWRSGCVANSERRFRNQVHPILLLTFSSRNLDRTLGLPDILRILP